MRNHIEVATPGDIASLSYDQKSCMALMTFGIDLTQMAVEGKLDPVIGREKQIEQMAEILCKSSKNNACLIGDPGVGKTVIVRGLALNMTKSIVHPDLQGKRIFSLDMGRLTARAVNRGQLEERFRMVVDAVINSNGGIILFLDELHTLIGTGYGGHVSYLDAAHILKPHLARGELKCIGATTLEGYKYIEKDPTLRRIFQVVQVPEPSVDETIQILRGIKRKFQDHHKVTYLDDALIASSKLSKRYISDAFLPDKAIDVVDGAGARMMLHGGNVVTSEVIEEIISSQTGIPVEKISGQGSARLLQLEKIFQKQIIGQDEAIEAVARAIRRASVGFGDPDRPVASLFFTGPTGVGKTEVAKLLALEYFGSKESMVRLDMSEYSEKHSVSKLIGSAPGYVGCTDGGPLTEAVRKKPHCLILLDEVEKAHQDIFNTLLQVLEDGRLTDGKGVVGFKDTIIIMTSNTGFSHDQEEARLEDVNARLKESFTPEFLNRLDEIIIFKRLGESEMVRIIDVMLKQTCDRIKTSKDISLEILNGFKERLISELGGSSIKNYGARPLKRAITRKLVDKLAENLIKGNIKVGDSLIVNVDSKGDVRFLRKDGCATFDWYLDNGLETEDWDVIGFY